MFKKKSQQVRRTYGGWDDDDNSSSNNNQPNNPNVPKFLKNQNQNPQNQYSSNNNTYSQKQNQNLNYNQDIRRDNQTFDLEQKLFEDILQPTGISVKPDLKFLRDFCQRAQRLDKNKIINLIMERIVKFKVYVGGEASIKMFLKCLYLVEFIIDNQVNELYDGFCNQNELFENIKMTYSNNKKFIDVINHILKMLYNQQNENNNQGTVQKSNTNLLDIDDGSNNNQQGNTNLLEDIFSGGSNNNINSNIGNNDKNLFNLPYQNNNVPFNIPTNNTNQIPIMSNQQQQQTQQSNSQFGFIKSQQGNQNQFNNNQNVQNVQNTQNTQKKGFSFIKNQQNTSNVPSQQATNDLNNIFQNPQNQNQTTNTTNKTGFKFIKKQENVLENVFNTQNTNINNNNTFDNIDLTKQNQQPIEQQQQPPQPIFNYQQVYENTEILNTKKKMNDPFNFVDDLLKPKK